MNQRCKLYVMIFPFFYLLFTFCCLNTIQATEKNTDEKSFYALSSLYYYLEEKLASSQSDEDEEESIVFSPDEVDQLWAQAASNSYFSYQIAKAQHWHLQATNRGVQPHLANQLLQKSHEILKDIWNQQNTDFLRSILTLSNKPSVFYGHSLLQKSYPYFENNPFISSKVQNKIAPYLLPSDHTIRIALDAIFTQTRAIKNKQSLIDAGFIIRSIQRYSHAVIASHPFIEGYLMKMYLDTSSEGRSKKPGWQWLVKRCQGAENVRNLITAKQLQHFIVPDKWIYPIPVTPATLPDNASKAQPIILVVTDMQLVSRKESEDAWKSLITPEHLDELYCILSHGFSSCSVVGNIPYTRSGKFACIDTEYPKRKLDYKKVKPALSKEMRQYWDELVKKGGNLN